jgi:hypothetical protein
MGLFSNMMDKIFRRNEGDAATPSDLATPGSAPPKSRVQMATEQNVPVSQLDPNAAASPSSSGAAQVDVAAVLDGMASSKGEKLDWRHSIVDLMKVVDMDSSLSARKELAADLNYSGDTNDSAAMNIWLHKEVMRRFAQNGGKLPADLDVR